MIPSLVLEDVRRGVAETLRAQFEPSMALFKDAVRRLVDEPQWVKGPYMQLGLPFVKGASGRQFFSNFDTEFPAHRHQELAWIRCAREQRSMLVATGTGSGKTECFVYPLLDHIAQALKAGVPGVKAIIIMRKPPALPGDCYCRCTLGNLLNNCCSACCIKILHLK